MRSLTIPNIMSFLILGIGKLTGGSVQILAEFPRFAAQPSSSLVESTAGSYVATTHEGGRYDKGTLYRVSANGNAADSAILYHFGGNNGAGEAPSTGLSKGLDGKLYGTTLRGGEGGYGTVFRADAAGRVETLVSFTGAAGNRLGAVPAGILAHSDGNFYGLTAAGGRTGNGTIFKLTSAGMFTTLVEFSDATGVAKGREPVGTLVGNGTNLYGVTKYGGTAGNGVVFRLTTSGSFTVMAEFSGQTGSKLGASARAGLYLNPTDSALYGVTEYGGSSDFGTAFKLTTAATPVFTTLHQFSDSTGSQPSTPLVKGPDGGLFGCVNAGGTAGLGGVYRLSTSGGYALLTSFTGEQGAAPGAAPKAGLVVGGDGQLWGTTSSGGAGQQGAVFKISTSGQFTSLVNFTSELGWGPSSAPVATADGSWLMGMRHGGRHGVGTLTRLRDAVVSPLVSFDSTIGECPQGDLVEAGGVCHGYAAEGGASGLGAIWKYDTSGRLSSLTSFTTVSGVSGDGGIVPSADGQLLVTLRGGGPSSYGTVCKVGSNGSRTRLASFTGRAGALKGGKPRGRVLRRQDGWVFGATETGGKDDVGAIFAISPTGVANTMVEFSETGPRSPLGGLAGCANGIAYLATSRGGESDLGALLAVNLVQGTWSQLASFGPESGCIPAGNPVEGPDGAIYILTTDGGAHGCGTVARYSPKMGLTNVLDFSGYAGTAPGCSSMDAAGSPLVGGLGFAADGSLLVSSPEGGSGGGGSVLRLEEGVMPYANWKASQLGSLQAEDAADPDKDGVANILEYALGSDPNEASATGQSLALASLIAGAASYRPALRFTRNLHATDVELTVEESTLAPGATWQATQLQPEQESYDAATGVAAYLLVFPESTNEARKFFRFAAKR